MEEKELFQELLIKYLDGRLSQEEKATLLGLLKADHRYFDEMLETKDIWDSAEANLKTENQDTEVALSRFDKKLSTPKTIFNTRSVFSTQFGRIAASLLILMGFSFLFLYLREKNTENRTAIAEVTYNEIVVPKGQKSKVALNDGTKIWLNGNSVLRYPSQFDANSRNVELEGEAYLEVAKDKSRPFFVKTSELTVKVLGTKFNVKAYRGDKTIETTLIEGSVKILPTNNNLKLQETLLKPNEKATFNKVGRSLVLENLALTKEKTPKEGNNIEEIKSIGAEVEPIISWKDDKLIFNDESLAEIALKMERWFGVDVEFDTSNRLLNSYRYTGKFVYNESIERVMEVINVTTPLHYEIEQNKLTIQPR